ncbi:Peroxin 5 [Carabus blaptoides fortunei]
MVEQFLQESRAVPQTFHMDGLLQEMREIESQRFAMPPVPASKVKDHLDDDTWALQYLQDGKKFEPSPNQEEVWTELSDQVHPDDLNELGLGEDWARDYLEQASDEKTTEANEVQQTAKELLNTVNDPKFAYSKFMKFMNQVGEGSLIIEDGKVIGDIKDDVADKWAQEFSGNNNSEEVLSEKWSNEYNEVTDNKNANGDIWSKFHEEWKKLSDEDTTNAQPWLSEYSELYDPYKEYNFSETNPMSELMNPLEAGKEKLAAGDLPSAVLCFEAAVKKEPENAEAWQLLGTTQAENEQDPNAIYALKQCIKLEPSNLIAIMSLAVCYTNENYQNQACFTLANWLKTNPKYTDLVPADFNVKWSVPAFLSQDQHKQVQDMFIRAAQRNPIDIDYEVQCCLGVLFNLSGEYDKAVDCFKTALQIKPDDSRLWNRLGATLANGNRPEEAVDAYYNALRISPGFIRARYNVGITCINLGAHNEAAEHFLTALNQQAKGRDLSNLQSSSQISDTIWSTLRMCVGLMNRPELKSFTDNKDLNALNKAFDITDI